MCDTLVALSACTANAAVLFAKNSDRQPNEAQLVEFLAPTEHDDGADLRCTHITIRQARQTNGVLLCRPYWIWGGEMGANDKGVVIGNEGLHARVPAPQQDALTGMDLLRLGLERGSSAREAVDVITELLAAHGQGGNCGHETPDYYHNGFMVADRNEAFVLETVGREWLIEPVESVRTLSNIYSVRRKQVTASRGIGGVIAAGGLVDDGVSDFCDLITNPGREHLGQAGARRRRSAALLSDSRGSFDVAAMMAALRDHGPHGSDGWHPATSDAVTLCMHLSASIPGNTAGSMVSELVADAAVHWVTATATPCLSVFKPVLLDAPMPDFGARPQGLYDASSHWWRQQRLGRKAACGDFPRMLEHIAPERDTLEASFIKRISDVLDGGNRAERAAVVAACWSDAAAAEARWVQMAGFDLPETYPDHWQDANERAGFPRLHDI